MNTGIITSGSLECWRQLYYIKIPRFNLCLDEKMIYSVEFLNDKPKESYFRLIDYRLVPSLFSSVICTYSYAVDAEKFS